MQRIIIALFLALSFVPAMADDDENAVTKKNLKSFNLNVGDKAILNDDAYDEITGEYNSFNFDSPSAGESTFIENLKVSPEIRYYKPEDYSERLDQYDAQVKVKVGFPVDF